MQHEPTVLPVYMLHRQRMPSRCCSITNGQFVNHFVSHYFNYYSFVNLIISFFTSYRCHQLKDKYLTFLAKCGHLFYLILYPHFSLWSVYLVFIMIAHLTWSFLLFGNLCHLPGIVFSWHCTLSLDHCLV